MTLAGLLRFLAAMGALAVGGVACATSQARPAQDVSRMTDVSRGRAVYRQYCRTCHGRFKPVSSLPEPPRTREYLLRTVREGRAETTMFGYQTLLTEAQLAAVVDYLLSTLGAEESSHGKTR